MLGSSVVDCIPNLVSQTKPAVFSKRLSTGKDLSAPNEELLVQQGCTLGPETKPAGCFYMHPQGRT